MGFKGMLTEGAKHILGWKSPDVYKRQVVAKHKPDIIVPEIEAIRTERLYHLEQEGIQVVPRCV